MRASLISAGIIAVSWFCFPAEVGAQIKQDPVERELYDQGIDHYLRKEWEQSREKFRPLIEANHIAPELYYNMGTVVEKLNQQGEAVLWMRRAKLIDPGMVEPDQNLTFLKQKLGYLEFANEGLQGFLRNLPPSLGNWIAMIGLWVGAICCAAAFLLPQYREHRFRPLLCASLAAALAFGGAWLSGYYRKNLAIENFATITANEVTARTAPVPDAKAVIDLPPGSEVRILQEAGPWTYVAIPGDLRGWVRNGQLSPVWPVTTPSS